MTYVSTEIRRAVRERASGCCEYCLRSQQDIRLPYHAEHILPVQHGGTTTLDNLALSCPDCNAYKGPNIGSYDNGAFAPLYNPRTQKWQEHFLLQDELIQPLTAEGRVTIGLLQLNQNEYLLERKVLIALNRYPCQVK